MRKVIALAVGKRAQRILDVGCGDGAISLLLKQTLEASEVCGIEIATEGVRKAISRGVRVVQLDVDSGDFPFEDGYFDFIFCGEIMEHIFDIDHLFDEIHRVLRPRGLCIITTPNLGAWYNRIGLLLGYQPYSVSPSIRYYWAGKPYEKSSSAGRDHIRFLTLKAFKELARLHGFRLLSVVGACAEQSNLKHFSPAIRYLDRVLSRFPSLSTTIVSLIERTSI